VTGDGTLERQLTKLRKDLGEVFLAALADPDTVEICLNADGSLWQERLGEPLQPIGTMSASCADAAMRTIAAYHHATLTRDDPSIECELPLDGSRFAGQIPPIVTAPVFAVRKRASRVFTLDQYVDAGIMTPQQKKSLCEAIRDHRNILVTGSTGSGKTTVLNALIHALTDQFPNERLIIIEDTAEIQCAAKDFVQYHTSPERGMTQLVRMALRMRPDRILVGEVRGPEALDLLMVLNQGICSQLRALYDLRKHVVGKGEIKGAFTWSVINPRSVPSTDSIARTARPGWLSRPETGRGYREFPSKTPSEQGRPRRRCSCCRSLTASSAKLCPPCAAVTIANETSAALIGFARIQSRRGRARTACRSSALRSNPDLPGQWGQNPGTLSGPTTVQSL
jgi:type IV secretion system protein TrbB